jgi:hypothetical protein
LPAADLPFIDEHAVEVAAPPERAWDAVCQVIFRSFRGRSHELFARLLGAAETSPRGDPPRPGSAITGFRIVSAEAPVELALEGRHRFSRYALILHVDALSGDVRAETRATFPGLHGRAYRALVIGTRAHVLVVKRLLRAVRTQAEQPPP